MKTKIVLGVAAITLSLVAIKSFTPALAYQGDPAVRGPNYSDARHQINVTAFQKSDYDTWVKNMAGRGAVRFVTKANFSEFAKAQLAAQNGDRSLLDAFRSRYNWTTGRGMGQGHGMRSAQ